MRVEKITPTDLDGLVEFHNKGYFLIELKLDGVLMPKGQEIAIERLCDDLVRVKPKTIAVVARHETPLGRDIDCKSAIVDAVRECGRWIYPERTLTVGEAYAHWVQSIEPSAVVNN